MHALQIMDGDVHVIQEINIILVFLISGGSSNLCGAMRPALDLAPAQTNSPTLLQAWC